MGEYKPQVDSSMYNKDYFTDTRIESCCSQFREVVSSNCENILEIGVGGNMLKHMLSYFPHIKHTSLDLAEDLNPDYVGSVTAMPFQDNEFDLTICCQVLEHLEFKDFQIALEEIRRVTRKRIILSLPDRRKKFGFNFVVSNKKSLDFVLDYRLIPCKKIDSQHYWEIGYKGSSGRKVVNTIIKAGFKIIKSYRLGNNSWHCFYILDVDK